MNNQKPPKQIADELAKKLAADLSGMTNESSMASMILQDLALESLIADGQKYLKVFSHTHVNNGINDVCKQCGLDLRDKIHHHRNEQRRGSAWEERMI